MDPWASVKLLTVRDSCPAFCIQQEDKSVSKLMQFPSNNVMRSSILQQGRVKRATERRNARVETPSRDWLSSFGGRNQDSLTIARACTMDAIRPRATIRCKANTCNGKLPPRFKALTTKYRLLSLKPSYPGFRIDPASSVHC